MTRGFQGLTVCVDHRPLPNGTGVASYARAVREALSTIVSDPLTLEADRPRHGMIGRWTNWRDAVPLRARPLRRNGSVLSARDVFRIAQVHFDIHRRALALRAPFGGGLIHWSYPVPLHVVDWVNLYTVHDAIPLTHSELTPIDPRRHLRLLGSVAAVADHIVTVSDASRDSLIETMGWRPERITNCGAAIAEAPAPEAGSRDYLILCGSIEPRKNVARVIEGYARSGVAMPLLIVGPDGWQAASIRGSAAETSGVRWMGYRDRAEVTALIGGARALLMPSLAEGFGLPLLEAMALGTPVITSERGATAEVTRDAALLVDPADTNAIAAAIRRVAGDDILAGRLATHGRARAKMFSIERFAARLASAYGNAVASHGRTVGSG